MAVDDYRLIAEALAGDIAAGRLRPGDRLPPQRAFARSRGIAPSTAARVYGELVRRGLATGEVGRGTFVRAAAPPAHPPLAEPAGARVDLELNFPVPPEQPALLAPGLERLLRPDALGPALAPATVTGPPGAREAAAQVLTRAGWTPDPERVLFAGNGRQAIAAAVSALVPVGARLGVEALTYPVVKGIAARLGVTLVPLPMDPDGLVPEALREARVRAVYVQPTLHNPLGVTMPPARRAALAAVLDELEIFAIEDAVYSFLRDEPAPLAAAAPARTLVVESLSKRLSPGLTLGFLVTPPGAVRDRVAAALRSGGWAAGGFALAAATGWMADGTTAGLVRAKRRDAAERQLIAGKILGGYALRADPHAYHCWWELPEPWRAETFVAAAARHGIAVTPAAAFAVGPAHSPNAVRLALAAPPLPVLAGALETLAALAREEYAGVD
ncbi:PLP-dependent aminotransferase family protein [Phytohabitans sp. ZYX-F-186]|uniref:PLP-dependent aminotransferase family protein n=1 Tax=Phytohabitans maris TaxID=3071409 RepID=A0ABU0ZL55_9ACTN|nr:PLP-dependent aminotransferase family protein [Phytohabitans sp. ZYX-F-186]MDQ7907127.1 PLP-dependent aminotransferase family protein [Phytohabitans sp. ZYX-F-186]